MGLLLPRAAAAQSADNVLVVINDASPASVQVGEYYVRKRAVPSSNVLHVTTSSEETITRVDYLRSIEVPLASWLSGHSAQDRILYIVLTKGIPIRIAGTFGRDGTVASVDSELTLLYRGISGQTFSIGGRISNPYFLGYAPIREAKPFTHEAFDIFLVTRLDGFSVEDVMGLIDRGVAPVRNGKIVLDQKAGSSDPAGNRWLQAAADHLKEDGFAGPVLLESTERVAADERGVLGYYSWGSSDPAIRRRRLNLGFQPGAIAAMFVSTDARTFREPPAGWSVADWGDPKTYYAGSPQSLTGDLIREGVTGVAGHVIEPFLDAAIRPDILFPAYTAGFNLAEAFYLAMPYLSWQTIVIGDPLCAPFRTKSLSAEQVTPGIDPATEMPVFFGGRRAHIFSRPGASQEAIGFALRAEVRLAKGDVQGARDALEKATVMDEGMNSAHLMLTTLYQATGEYEKAIDRFQRILKTAPRNPVVLNDLANALAVRRNAPRDALPYAQQAYRLAESNPLVADTLGWIHHLLGDDPQARTFIVEAVRGAPDNAEVQLHAAVVYYALGELAAASQSLDRALALAPQLEKNAEIARLRDALKKPA